MLPIFWFRAGFMLRLFLLAAAITPTAFADSPKVIHVFVALCDNASQGIIPVPAKIGNGEDLDNNLYWGCDDGLRSHFKQRKVWRLVTSQKSPKPDVLERLVFRHSRHDAWLVADAYRGSAIKLSLEDFFAAAAGRLEGEVTVIGGDEEKTIRIGGKSSLIAFIGHNGLMDFPLPVPAPARDPSKPAPAIVLCCKSDAFFTASLRQCGAEPLLMTTQLMYPGSFILHSALDGWLDAKSPRQLHDLAAAAYARNQKISTKAARGVFVAPGER